MTSRTADRLTALALFLFALAYFSLLAPYGIELADEGHLLHQIYRTYLGQLPYVDFHTGYSPGAYYLNAWLLHAFDANLLAVRLCLALVNSLCVAAVYRLTRRLGASIVAALLAGAGYIALIPFFDGQFAPFNIPYPAWYVTVFWLAAALCLLRWWSSERVWWLLLAGAAAGLVFSFKQNSGLLALAMVLLSVVLLQRPTGRGLLLALDRLERWAVPLILTLGFFQLFGGLKPGSQALPLVGPLLALLAGIVAVPWLSPARPSPAGRLTRDLIVLSLGFGAMTVPWLLYFWEQMGTVALLRDIFYIGTPYEQHYLIPYPSLGSWGLALAAGAVGLVILPAVARRAGVGLRAALTLTALLAIGAAAIVILRPPPMVEGLQNSVVMRARDVSFAAVLVLLWAGGAAYFSRAARRSPRAGVHLILLLSAVLMHMQIYPRSDFMHLVYAAPGAMILGAWLLDGWATRFAVSLGIEPRRLPLANAMLQAPAGALVLIFLVPALARIDYLVRAWSSGDPTALVRLESPRAPLVVEPAAGRMFESLSAAVRFLHTNTTQEDRVFTFPCLDLMTFLAERQDPSRHGYYYPGSPGHAVEAEVVDALEATPPRYIVTLHDHALFFIGAPVYYFNLRQQITEAFVLDRRLGQLDVLVPRAAVPGRAPANGNGNGELHRTVELWIAELRHSRGRTAAALATTLAERPPRSSDDLALLLTSVPPPQRRLIAELVRKSRSGAGAAALAGASGDPALEQREFQFYSRIISAVGDLRAVPALVAALESVPTERRAWIEGNLFTIGSKSWIETYFYAPDAEPLPAPLKAALPAGRLIDWIQDPWENPALRSFAMRMAGRLGDPATAPFLVRIAGNANEIGPLRLDAAHSLVEMGFGPWALPILATMLTADPMVSSTLIAAVQPAAPDAVREIVAAQLASSVDAGRAQAFWLAGALRDPALVAPLRQGLADPAPEVRMAAAWALGRIGDADARAALADTRGEPHPDVRAFLDRARAKTIGR